ncbi:type I polyketide synthase [Actinacidiphila oryziradicis]|uniref:SDR family NAD(P)-dependent oxidoreductase n=1 Tax=Actinacidiphila oryziradicis TaxID=2571141 RepID=A0A4U0S3Y9_9ACTN|nr:type I polyketide synthase [Actinacidiphila oryziradicis]TKA02938.1 SDR family NAD(P)-dependent oxidoreductase [Actinacidiphila oryziradicis]
MDEDGIKTLPVSLHDNAARHGDKVAFEDDYRAVGYAELQVRTGRIAGHLAALGLARGDCVAIFLRNSVATIESYLAIVRAAGVGVPINPASTRAELDYLLADSGASVVITDQVGLAELSGVSALADGGRVLVTGDMPAETPAGLACHSFEGLARTEPAVPARDDLDRDEVAWIFYTSGTTGKPKGVRSTQGNCLYSVAKSYVPIPGLTEADRVVWPLPLFHSLSHIACVLAVTTVGATARILDAASAQDVLIALRETRATFAAGVPTVYQSLIEAARREPVELPDLRVGLVGGAVASPELCRTFRETFGVPLVDAYGSTETCGAITMNPPYGDRVEGSCGRPVPGVQVEIVDPDTGIERPPGVEGEVWVSGPNVMVGYHNLPDETAAVLRDGWYHTGDLAWRDEEGYFRVCGRISDLIIRGGENFHPEEVELVIRGLPGVADVAVTGQPDERLGEVPVAYLVPDPTADLDVHAVLAHCREVLAAPKVPEALYTIDVIPRTASGKVQRRLLNGDPSAVKVLAQRTRRADAGPQARPDPAIVAALRAELAGLSEPAQVSRLERMVRTQAAVVAGRPESEPIAGNRAFRDLGYTSVDVLALRDRLVAGTGLKLPSAIVFTHPTPRALAAYLHAELTGRAAELTETVEPADGADPADPIAIVGMACRLPGGVRGPDDLWELVRAGSEAGSPFPDDRGWNLAAVFDADPLAQAGFLDGAGDFDADFFGISPNEALAMDPQQRQLLETAWEAMEHAGLDVAALHGTDVGVYFGLMDQGYGGDRDSAGHSPELAGFVTTGSASSVASGRVSYLFGFGGPAVTVDTACSSSLVSLHLAAQALRAGECSVALAGGATVMATPRSFTEFARQGALAGDGRIKSYADAADGTNWAEGAGVLVLERLSDAQRAGHRVLAVLRGSAINSDGASNGLTAPSGPAQQRVIRRALAVAGLRTEDVDVVEGHGTGTVLGDPIEAEALLATYGREREAGRPLWLGSLKSNVGHTQAAAGVAGVIKMVQALRHGVLPRTLHVDEPSGRVDWADGGVELLTAGRTWPDLGRPRRAGVSAFGLSGTNAHVILEQAAESPAARDGGVVPAVVPIVVSAASEGALRARAGQLADLLAEIEPDRWVDVARALIAHRTALPERAVVLAGSRAEAVAALSALADGNEQDGPFVVRGRDSRSDTRSGVVMVFPGQGSQWRGMGRELLETSPVFAEKVGECARLMAGQLDWSLLDVLRAEADDAVFERVDVVQPASFAVMVGLAAVWASLGVVPDAVVGHSQGEVAAAYVAGALSLSDALRVVVVRSEAIARTLAGRGGMASVGLSAEAAESRIAAWAGRVAVAAVNSPVSVVLSGGVDALDEALAALERDGVRVRRVAVDYASHTEQVAAVRAELADRLSDMDASIPGVPFHSTVTGGWIDEAPDAEYWYRNLREQVRFGPAVATLLDQGFSVFVEASAHPVLAQPVAQVADAAGVDVLQAGSLRRDDGGLRRLLTSAAELFVQGVPVRWAGILPEDGARWVDLPTYPFEHERYWLAAQPAATTRPDGLFRTEWLPVSWPAVTALSELQVLEPDTATDDPKPAVHAALGAVQEFLARPEGDPTRLAVVVADRTRPAAAAVWGLVRSAQSEQPGRIVLVETDEATRPSLAEVVSALPDEPQLCLRAGTVAVARLVPVAETHDEQFAGLDPDGTVLITGGTGTLGALTARHLVTRHAVRHLLLAGRLGPDAEGADELREELAALGAQVRIVAADVADRTAVAELLGSVAPDHPLTAVVHTAGVLNDAVLTELTPDRVDAVFGPKVDGARHLDELTRELPLAAFVLFSSAAGVLGNPGQGNYAAANAALDALSIQRRAAGLPSVSIAWGYWAGASGLTRHLGQADMRRNRDLGMLGLSDAHGLALLDSALTADAAVVAARFDFAALGEREVPALLRELVEAPRVERGKQAALVERINVLADPSARTEALVSVVQQHAAAILGHADPAAVRPDRAFKDAGFDSLTALELRNRLATATEHRLPASIVFDHPTPSALARHLLDRLFGGDPLFGDGAPAAVALPARVDEPIAIVSMACRFPGGVDSPEDLWRVLVDETDVITEFPADRGWDVDGVFHPDPDHPGTTYVRHGGFLDDAAGFDAAFFGISPNEALAMDPQQRLLLEASWEALERAGIDPTALGGQEVGVFVGVNSHDWTVRTHRAAEVEGFRLTGTSGSVVSGRVAYHLGLRGPAITVDTACSSSLVALHLATQALRAGECSMALVGGVMVMSTVETFVEFSRQRGLAPDGRCKPFADAADGTGWSEGAGMLLVEPLSAAQRLGHQVLAVVRGSAVNSDGSSNGLTAPNGPAQQQVIRRALAAAGLRADEVDAVEAHGTGTTLGDPIEAQALLESYGRDRPGERPLWVGSVKSNLGHTQAAAGAAGIMKMVLAMRHGRLPRTLHVDRPSSHVDWSAGAVRLLTQARDWPSAGRPLRAGVSSFGIGGTNAHVILESAPERAETVDRQPVPDTPWTAVPLSARTPGGLRGQAERLAAFLDARPDVALPDAALALATGRAHLDRRCVFVVRDRAELMVELDAVRGGSVPAVAGQPAAGKLAMLFTGQGSQWAGMGRALAAAHPVFAEAFASACRAVDQHLPDTDERTLAEVVFAEPGPTAALLDQTIYTQAGLFALETALYRLLESWGIRADLVAGHSIGEIAAAHVAGALDLDQAGELVAARGALMWALPAGGAMVAVQATEQEVAPLVAASAGAVFLAAVNSANSVVLSGDEKAVLDAAAQFAAQGRKTRRLRVSHAFHSARMDPMLAEFGALTQRLAYRRGGIPMVSTLTGRLDTEGRMAAPDYWVEQVRGTVRFGDAVRDLHDQGATTFLEVGPGGALTAMAVETLGLASVGCVATLRTADTEPADVLSAIGELHVRGVAVDWPSVLGRSAADARRHVTELPTYAFDRRRYWIDAIDTGEAPAPMRPPAPAPEPMAPVTSGREREQALLDLVLDSARVVLGYRDADAGIVEADRPFQDLGFDSLAGVRLSRRLHDLTGIDVASTAVFNHPTPQALADHLAEGTAGRRARTAPAPVSDADEPIAIVAASVRLPGGVDSPEALWELVGRRRDAISEFPVDRGWDLDNLYHPDPGHPGTSYTRFGGFLHDAAQFDADLFGISPREALAMDPQQRLLLEISWEALERAGIDPLSLRGKDVGVFTGIVHHDYVTRLREVPDEVAGYVMTGTSPSVASGRISYVFGLTGPAMSVDTACSSSLVTIHLAAQALRRGECAMALAGGATVMASPAAFVEFSRQRGLSADGRCKAFGAGADGTGWSEGAGMVLLERLSVAREQGHPVLAVIRGSAVSQDGASNGLTAPNGLAQQRVIEQALADAGLATDDVDVVEAHGTGTMLGDPIEAQALLATYGAGRDPRQPLWLGSLKSNIGHTQAAAGVAGVVKMVEALRHAELPATLHAQDPTPQVDWSAGTVALLTEARDWPGTGRPRRAAVSAFGASGTNAHVILEQAPDVPDAADAPEAAPAPARPASTGALPLVVSAKTRPSLAEQASRLLARITEDDLPGLAAGLVTGRAALAERAVVVADSVDAARSGLAALAAGDPAPNLVTATAARPGRIVFVFPGQGSQWTGMGAALIDESPVFAARVAQCADALAEWVDWPLLDVLRGTADPALYDRVDVIQPASFAVMVGLAAVWESFGVRPDAVLGHSQGEIAAACVAGALSLSDAARIVAVRSTAIATTLSGRGGMVSVRLGEDEARERIAAWDGRIEVAVVNSPSSVVVAGDTEAVREAVAELAAEGVTVREVPVDYASHTRHVEGIEDTLGEALGDITAQAPAVPFFSTVTGGWITEAGALDGGYWYRNLRQQVRFGSSAADLLGQGHGVFLEVSAHPVLVQPITDLVDGQQTIVTGTLRRDDGGLTCLLASAARLFTGGVPIDWSPVAPAVPGTPCDLPTYAFQRKHYWLTESASGEQQADAPDSEFWTAIEQASIVTLSTMLDVPEDGRLALATLQPMLADWHRRSRERSSAQALRYTVGWKPIEQDVAGVPGGRWLAVAPEDPEADEVLDALRAHGLDLITLRAGSLDRLGSVLAEHGSFAGVLSLAGSAADREPAAAAVAGLELVKALASTEDTGRLWCLTRGAVGTGIRDRVAEPAQAAIWGLGRVAALEWPDRWGGLIDLPGELDSRAVTRVLGVLNGATGEDQLAVRRSGIHLRRLRRAAVAEAARGGHWHPHGTVLVTGGAEGLGRHCAYRLAQAGAARLVVTTAEATPPDAVANLRARIDALGTGVVVEACEEGDRDTILRLAAADPDHPLTVVVHAADVTMTSALADTTAADVAAMYQAKVATADWLGEQFGEAGLDALVLFSSIAGIWGGATQGLAAAANAVLDALAERLRAQGCPATSMAWGALTEAGVGMDEAALARLRRLGLVPIDPEHAMTALEQAVLAGEKAVTVAGMNWEAFLPTFTSVRPSPLFADLPEAQALAQAARQPGDDTASELGASLRGATEAEQERILLRLVRGHASTVLGHGGAEGIGARQAFQEAGFDSLAAVNLRNSLIGATGLNLPATLIFDYPNPASLAQFLRLELLRENDELAGREAQLRRVLAAVPFERFRDAGILAALLSLGEDSGPDGADDAAAAAPDAPDTTGDAIAAEIDLLDIDSLVQRALGDSR